MNFATKLIVSTITIAATIVGSIWAGFETLDSRMDSKVEYGKQQVMEIVYNLKEERNALFKAQDEKVVLQYHALQNEVTEMKKDIRVILGIARRSQVFVEKENPYYTIIETKQEGKSL